MGGKWSPNKLTNELQRCLSSSPWLRSGLLITQDQPKDAFCHFCLYLSYFPHANPKGLPGYGLKLLVLVFIDFWKKKEKERKKCAKRVITISLPLYTINTYKYTCFLVLSWCLASSRRWLKSVSSFWLFPLTLGQIQDTDMHKYPHICQHLPVKFQGCQLWDVPDLKRDYKNFFPKLTILFNLS